MQADPPWTDRVLSALDEMAEWSEWVPFGEALASAPLVPGVYMAREGTTGPIVYVGMAGERAGRTGTGTPKGHRGRLRYCYVLALYDECFRMNERCESPLQRLGPDATTDDAWRLFRRRQWLIRALWSTGCTAATRRRPCRRQPDLLGEHVGQGSGRGPDPR